ncbi:hypothetical protein V496_00996 [Pseudogymnoascus sp. VKM F-4515 (FW-2607)]|nr:hypothetical protein V496_00996 [Pseudogymnoascus sp. VKM F-4515 (FW-2607)]
MQLPLIALLTSLTAVLAAPSALESRALSCNVAVGDCKYQCSGTTIPHYCINSYCKASGTSGPYGYCVCKC